MLLACVLGWVFLWHADVASFDYFWSPPPTYTSAGGVDIVRGNKTEPDPSRKGGRSRYRPSHRLTKSVLRTFIYFDVA